MCVLPFYQILTTNGYFHNTAYRNIFMILISIFKYVCNHSIWKKKFTGICCDNF